MKSLKFKRISKLDFSDETIDWLESRIFRLWKIELKMESYHSVRI